MIRSILLVLSTLLFSACAKDDEGIFTRLSVRLVMPDNRPVEQLKICDTLSYFYNINTYERIAFPPVVDNNAVVTLRKGVYTLIVEADATYSPTETRRLRAADYNQTTQAVTWVEDSESLVLLLKTVN